MRSPSSAAATIPTELAAIAAGQANKGSATDGSAGGGGAQLAAAAASE